MLGLRTVKNRSEQEKYSPFVGSHDTGNYSTERRRSNRVETEILITATTEDGTEYFGYTRDLSREGCRVFIHGSLSEGDEITLTFRPAGEFEKITLKAIIRTALCERYGLEFCDTDSSQHEEHLVAICKLLALSEFPHRNELTFGN
jgi:hypothetical protein